MRIWDFNDKENITAVIQKLLKRA